uniref:uncharacterized protein LOC120329075 n=1 Tax=Styela clava TaxID=7725 RepID=UPI001939B0E9|nr:uncharacterized protein LOC120329075 [Styela clava]
MDTNDIPDLDDMSDLVQNIKLNKQKTYQHPTSQKGDHTVQQKVVENAANCKKVPLKKLPSQFGGMKKGFLFGGNSGTKATHKPNSAKSKLKDQETDIIVPKHPSETQKNPLVLDDVQEAMKESGITDKSWVTTDLLKQVESNERLSNQLSDPNISKAISWMQRDPKGAMEFYKNDVEVQNFFKEFYGILGNHFTNIGAKQEEKTSNVNSEDEAAMSDILANPEIREILSKPDIQKLIELVRNNPDEAQKHLNAGNPAFRADVNKLVSAGILGFQPQ